MNTTDFAQYFDYDCGPSCVSFFAHMLDGQSPTGYTKLMEIMGTTPEQGTDTDGLVKGLIHLGFEAWKSEGDPQTQALWPYLKRAIWCVDNEEHWVVLLGGFGGEQVLYFDPETGNVHTCPWTEFDKRIASSGYTYVAAVAKEKNVEPRNQNNQQE